MPRSFFPGALALAAFLAAGCRDATPPAARAVDAAVPTAPDAGTALKARELVPPGPLRAPRTQFRFAVYYLPMPKVDPFKTLAALPQTPPYRLVTEIPAEPPESPTLTFIAPAVTSFAPPPPKALDVSAVGLDDAQKQALLASGQVSVLAFFAMGERIDALHEQALRAVAELARRTGGLPWDDVTRQAFSPSAWQARIDGFENHVPIASRHVRIDAYPHGDGLRIVTLGMQKMGLPDIAMSHVPPASRDAAVTAVSLLCQTLAERDVILMPGEIDLAFETLRSPIARRELEAHKASGARGRMRLRLSIGEHLDGDADNRLIEAAFPGAPEASLADLLGSPTPPPPRAP